MKTLEDLIHILEQSVKKNGEITLTNKHLLNILKMLRRKQEQDAINEDLIQAIIDSDH